MAWERMLGAFRRVSRSVDAGSGVEAHDFVKVEALCESSKDSSVVFGRCPFRDAVGVFRLISWAFMETLSTARWRILSATK